MYKVGDLVIYGSSGVCRIVDITARISKGVEQEQLYYEMSPLYQNCTIFTPVNNTKVFMRPIISELEAERLISMIPKIRAEAYHNSVTSQLTEHYKESLKTHDCFDLLKLCMSIYSKKQDLEQLNRKVGSVDEKFMKLAEELLFGELAAALNIKKEQVPAYISERIAQERE